MTPFVPDLSKKHYTCRGCGLTHKSVEAGGIWHCPNPFCGSAGNHYFRSRLKSYRSVDSSSHVIDDPDEWTTAAFDKAVRMSDAALRDFCLQWAAESDTHRKKMKELLPQYTSTQSEVYRPERTVNYD